MHAVLARAMDDDPARRYASALAFAGALESAAAARRKRAPIADVAAIARSPSRSSDRGSQSRPTPQPLDPDEPHDLRRRRRESLDEPEPRPLEPDDARRVRAKQRRDRRRWTTRLRRRTSRRCSTTTEPSRLTETTMSTRDATSSSRTSDDRDRPDVRRGVRRRRGGRAERGPDRGAHRRSRGRRNPCTLRRSRCSQPPSPNRISYDDAGTVAVADPAVCPGRGARAASSGSPAGYFVGSRDRLVPATESAPARRGTAGAAPRPVPATPEKPGQYSEQKVTPPPASPRAAVARRPATPPAASAPSTRVRRHGPATRAPGAGVRGAGARRSARGHLVVRSTPSRAR